ncbi:MAG: PhoX family phosphatase [Planctomycetaceae bacterium]|nr:PhoX family phosphatase [Planctomycetaceae bacterium]
MPANPGFAGPSSINKISSTAPTAKPMSDIIAAALGRRAFLQVSMSAACAAVMTPWEVVEAQSTEFEATETASDLFQFAGVSVSQRDHVVVPDGYVAEVLFRWGDPINGEEPIFRGDASNSAEDQARQAGMGHDGMEFFAIPGVDSNSGGLLCINHEYTDQILLFSDGIGSTNDLAMPTEKIRKSQAAHGVSVIEVAAVDGQWRVIRSKFSRRITANTPMRLTGPGTKRIGAEVLGTLNNCAAGRTPWGTYLTCEENFHGLFGTAAKNFAPTPEQERYGLAAKGYVYNIAGQEVSAYRWWDEDRRFDLSAEECDAERFGYVVEIDPLRPESKPVKRTALGRFRHENAELTLAKDGRVVVYMGDDQAGEFIYKFVSTRPYQSNSTSEFGVDSTGGLLDDGVLYAARYDESGRGVWLPLSESQMSADQIAVYTRLAASSVGATPMDRPEWLAVHPKSGEVFASLTNHAKRAESNPANPRLQNIYGHILRWREDGDDAAALEFTWRIFLLAGNPAHPNPERQGNVNGSEFACPDGLKFDPSGILWIQTDMSSSVMGNADFAALGNNMMLAADATSGAVRRFLTGPVGCEITGNAMTPDRCTMFINIQHPGEPADDVTDPLQPNQYSQWPDGPTGGRPRSATIVVRRLDGKPIGA